MMTTDRQQVNAAGGSADPGHVLGWLMTWHVQCGLCLLAGVLRMSKMLTCARVIAGGHMQLPGRTETSLQISNPRSGEGRIGHFSCWDFATAEQWWHPARQEQPMPLPERDRVIYVSWPAGQRKIQAHFRCRRGTALCEIDLAPNVRSRFIRPAWKMQVLNSHEHCTAFACSNCNESLTSNSGLSFTVSRDKPSSPPLGPVAFPLEAWGLPSPTPFGRRPLCAAAAVSRAF